MNVEHSRFNELPQELQDKMRDAKKYSLDETGMKEDYNTVHDAMGTPPFHRKFAVFTETIAQVQTADDIKTAVFPLPNSFQLIYLLAHGYPEDGSVLSSHFVEPPSSFPSNVDKGGALAGLKDLLDPVDILEGIVDKFKPDAQNMHVVLVVDACHSGAWLRHAEMVVDAWVAENGKFPPTCSLTVQAVCGEEQVAYGGFFAPFLFRHMLTRREDGVETVKLSKDGRNAVDQVINDTGLLDGFPRPDFVRFGTINDEVDRRLSFVPSDSFQDYCYHVCGLDLEMDADGKARSGRAREARIRRILGGCELKDVKPKWRDGDPMYFALISSSTGLMYIVHLHVSANPDGYYIILESANIRSAALGADGVYEDGGGNRVEEPSRSDLTGAYEGILNSVIGFICDPSKGEVFIPDEATLQAYTSDVGLLGLVRSRSKIFEEACDRRAEANADSESAGSSS